MVVGTVLAAARMRGPAGVRHAAVFVIEVVRANPQLMVIVWVFFTYPAITGGQSLSAWAAAVVSLSAIASAYLAEVIRAGISSVPMVQSESARVTGLTPAQGLVHVVLPQGLRNMPPALIAHLVMTFETTSLAYVIGNRTENIRVVDGPGPREQCNPESGTRRRTDETSRDSRG